MGRMSMTVNFLVTYAEMLARMKLARGVTCAPSNTCSGFERDFFCKKKKKKSGSYMREREVLGLFNGISTFACYLITKLFRAPCVVL